MSYLALCPRLPGNELAAAECRRLTGGTPDAEGVAVCQTVSHIWRAAYVHTGLRLIAEAETLDELAQQVSRLGLSADGFRVEFLRLTPQHTVGQREAVLALAQAIHSAPDLTNPRCRFLIVAGATGFRFGEIVAEADHSFQAHEEKPHHTSSAMPPRLARAMVNLALPLERFAPAGDADVASLLDPCCGTGTILIEACSLGLRASGSDRNPKMVSMTRGNLKHFGCTCEVTRADACQIERQVDAVVTDLPYGRCLEHDDQNVRAILRQMARLAPRGVFLGEMDFSAWLREAGYDEIEVFAVRKRAAMSRYIHVAARQPATSL